MTSKKISQFNQETAFLQTDLLNIVRNSTNYTVPFSAAATALGVTGTINIVGTAGSPVLEQPSGTVNNIRTLEDGNGILTAISATNGITISHNFTQDATGTQIVDDLASASPTFPSLLPGSGMQITRVGDVITFAATGALPATKVVNVNAIGDFPTASGGIITLVADTVYVISNAISTSDRFVLANNTSIVGWSVLGPLLEYTGTGTMFTSVDVDVEFLNLHVKATLGKVWDLSDTVGGVQKIGIQNVNIDACTDIGTFTALFSCAINNLICSSVLGDGPVFVGTGWQLISIKDMALITASATFVGVDFGSCVSESIDVINPFFSYVSGSIGFKGAASSANLSATGMGNINGASFIGAGTPLSTITNQDLRWRFIDNQDIVDTVQDSLSYNSAGTTVTISTPSVAVKIAGTWIDDNSSQFTVDLGGRVTYNGTEDLHAPIDLSVTADPSSGSNKDFCISVAINGTVEAGSCVPSRASNGDLNSTSTHWQYIFTTGDYIEAFIQNDTDTVNFDITHAILRIN